MLSVLRRRPTHSAGEDVGEVNIIPIVDCFTVVIVYLLSTASIISISSIYAEIVQSGAGGATVAQEQVSVSVTLQENRQLRIRVFEQKLSEAFLDQTANRDYDFTQLQQWARQFKEKYPGVREVSLLAEGAVEYQELIRAIASLHDSHAVVFVKEKGLWPSSG